MMRFSGVVASIFLFVSVLFVIGSFGITRPSHIPHDYLLDDAPLPFHDHYLSPDGFHTIILPVKNLDESIKNFKEKKQEIEPRATNGSDYYQFIPIFKASLKPGLQSNWSAPCHKTNQAQIELIDSKRKDTKTAEIKITMAFPNGVCSDWYLLATTNTFVLKYFFLPGTHTIELDLKEADEEEILTNGLQVFHLHDGLVGTVVNAILTWTELFACREDMVQHNLEFLKQKMNLTLKERPQRQIILDESEVKSGMYFGITRLDGLDPMIMWGTGSITGHTAMAMWMDNQLYVMESTGSSKPLTCQYWPPPETVMKTPYRKWIEDAIKADYMVSVTPLSPENQKKFNETKAIEFFKSVEGLPYGISNFLYGWVDTVAGNWPPPLSGEVVPIGFAILDRLVPSAAKLLYLDGINLRFKEYLGFPACEDIECVMTHIEKINMTFDELLTLTELDNWVYPDGKNMVCDVFVLDMYKAAGLYGDLTDLINNAEQTPRDSYMMKLYDDAWDRPEKCKVDNLPYCQILGNYTFEMVGWNTIPLYPHMNEKCNSLPTAYERCPGIRYDDPSCRC